MPTLLSVIAIVTMTTCGGVKTGKLLGLNAGGGLDGLYEIDVDTGGASLLHSFDFNRSEGALAVGPDGTLYAAFSGEFDSLMIINPVTGGVMPVGPFGFEDVSGLAFGPDGTLYGLDGASLQMITIDLETGAGTVLGPTDALVGTGLTFMPDGTLHAVGFESDGDPALFTVSLRTGAATEVGPFGGGLNITAALAAIGDVLYGSANEELTGDDWFLILDQETGEATKVGVFSGGELSMDGMVFLPGAGDADRDGDVDLDDFAIFQGCFTGPLDTEDPLPVACVFLDADDDNDLDLTDFADFQSAFTGPNDDNE